MSSKVYIYIGVFAGNVPVRFNTPPITLSIVVVFRLEAVQKSELENNSKTCNDDVDNYRRDKMSSYIYIYILFIRLVSLDWG